MTSTDRPPFLLIPGEALAAGVEHTPWRDRLTPHPLLATGAVELLAAALALWQEGVAQLAQRAPEWWDPPRWRSIVVLERAEVARPWIPLLNLGAWTLQADDLDPAHSHPEFVAYLLVLQDRQARNREVTFAPVHDAAWWFARSPEEIERFRLAAERSSRRDAPGLRAIAAATSWMRALSHETLRPPDRPSAHRAIPGTGLLVPREVEDQPPRLVAEWARIGNDLVARFHRDHSGNPAKAIRDLTTWLADETPPLLVTAARARELWDPETPQRAGALRTALRPAGPSTVASIHADLVVIAARTRAFLTGLRDPDSLPLPADTDSRPDQSGYSYLHTERRLITYDLEEPGIERLRGPAIPFAREMLAARTVHEWGHLLVDAGGVPRTLPADRWSAACEELQNALAEVVRRAPTSVKAQAARDIGELAAAERSRATERAIVQRTSPSDEPTPGEAVDDADAAARTMLRILLGRIPDWQANLVARRLLEPLELEVYVRHNIRPVRDGSPRWALWRRLARHLYEMQYLRLLPLVDTSSLTSLYARSTGLDAEILATEVLTIEDLERLSRLAAALCDAHEVDASFWIRLLPHRG